VVRAVAEDQVNGLLYMVGNFTTVGGQPRNRAACIDVNTGALTPWDPNVTGQVWSIALSGTSVYLGGDITDVGGNARTNIAEVNATTGAVTSWAPLLNGRVGTIQVGGGNVYIAGRFTTVNGATKRRIAAIDAVTGVETAFQANANAEVRALVLSGSTLYAGGNFATINGISRPRLAALDANTGAPSAWAPTPSGPGNIYSMVVDGTTIYVGGSFTAIGADSRNNIAAIDLGSGAALAAFNPGADNIVFGLGLTGGKIYAGGSFLNFGGSARNRFAVCDAATGTLDVFAQGTNNVVRAISANTNRVAIGGSFTQFNSLTRQRLAVLACNPATPTATANQTLCGGSTVADISAAGTNIQWYANPTGGTALASNTLLVDGTTYYATQSDGSCESVVRRAVTVTVNTVATPTGASTQNFCDAATVSNLIVSGSNIRWYDVPTGGTQLNSGDALTNGSTYYATQFLTGCESATRLAVTVNIFITSAPTATTPQAFCGSGTIAQLTATGNNIQWYADPTGGAPLSGITATADGVTYYATATDNNCESATRTPVAVIISSPIAAPIGIQGTVNVCGLTTVTYTAAPVTGATAYTWTLPAGATGSSTTNVISVTFDPSFISGNISCAANNAGCQSNNRTITPRRAPAQPATIVGQQDNLCGGNPYLYSIPNVAGATSYTWTVPAGATFTNPTPNSCSVTFPNGMASGVVTVTADNSCGSSLPRTRTVTTAPVTSHSISSPTSVCANQTGLVYSVAAINGATNIQWQVPTGASIVSGQGTPSITVNWGSGSGNVRALAVNACATGQAVQQRVLVTCRTETPEAAIENNAASENSIQFSIYPNPGTDRLTISINDEMVQGQKPVQILDVLGKQVWEGRLTQNLTEVDMSNLPSGMYFIRIVGAESAPQRWIKQ
jgi:hypothetical protein